ncbi:MAG TPA: PepSY domain-containing protein [Steroidobacteraceae bacterium]|nr:PepSY domain-containing protein [Steroidobacteraceae bacterium]
MKTSNTILIATCAALFAQGIALSYADDESRTRHAREHEEMRAALQRGEVLPLARILAIAQEKVPGDVIEVELESKNGALVYEIKVLTESGRVREIKIDARKGTVLEIEDD